jgi:hypothetical protein
MALLLSKKKALRPTCGIDKTPGFLLALAIEGRDNLVEHASLETTKSPTGASENRPHTQRLDDGPRTKHQVVSMIEEPGQQFRKHVHIRTAARLRYLDVH